MSEQTLGTELATVAPDDLAAPYKSPWERFESIILGTTSIVLLLAVWELLPHLITISAGTKLFFTTPSQVAGTLWAEDHAETQALAEAIGKGPGALRLSGDMVGVAWGKLLINLNNAVNALSGRTLLEQLSDRDYRRVVAASQVEALDILKAAGIRPAQIGPFPPALVPHVIAAPDFLFRHTVLRTQKIDASARSSMADDFAAGRPTEIDWLNGEVVALARRLGRRAPVNERIVALVKQAEAGVERAWSGEELRAHVLDGRAVAGFGY